MKLHLNLKEFGKIKQTPHVTIMIHPKTGQEVAISHHGLTPKERGELAAVPMHPDAANIVKKFAGGGDVQPSPTPTPAPTTQGQDQQAVAAQSSMRKAFHFDAGGMTPQDDVNSIPPDVATSVDQLPPVQATPQPSAVDNFNQRAGQLFPGNNDTMMPDPVDSKPLFSSQQNITPVSTLAQPRLPQDSDPYGYDGLTNGLMGAYGEERKGIQQEAQAKGALGQQEATAMQDSQKQMDDLMAQHQKASSDIENERSAIASDIANAKVDPSRLWNNKSTLGKIGANVGFILGGIGSGINGGPNLGIQAVNDAISRDIDSQKFNIKQKDTLLNANRQRFQDENLATGMTRVMLNDRVVNQLKVAAAQAQTPIEKARALQAVGQLDAQTAPLLQQMKMRKMMMNGIQEGNSNPALMVRVMQQSGMMDPADATAATKEIGQAQQLEKLRSDVEQGAHDLQARTFNGALTPGYKASKIGPYAGIIAKLGEGRFNLEEAKQQMNSLMPAAGDSSSTLSSKSMARKNFFDALVQTPTLQKYQLSVPKINPIARYTPNLGQPQSSIAVRKGK